MSSKRTTAAAVGSPSRPPLRKPRLSPIPSLSTSTVVALPPAFSSQISTQLNFSLPAAFNRLPISRQAAAFANSELKEILNDPKAAEEADCKEVQYFY